MISSIVYLSSPSETSTEQLAPVGTLRAFVHPDLGYQLLRSVKATTAVTANEVVQYDSGSAESVVKSSGAKQKACMIAGLAVSSIAAGSYGWVVCYGQAYALAHSTIGAGSTLMTSATAGRVNDETVGGAEHTVIGIQISDASAASAGDKITIRVTSIL